MDASVELVLRAHQSRGNQLLFAEWKAGRRKVLFVMPTGGGKRYSGVWLAKKTQSQGKRCLVVTDRRILVKQMYDELERFGVDYGIIMGDAAQNRDAPVQVASIHTLVSRHLPHGHGLPGADMVIVDEAHKSLDAYAELFKHYPQALIVGLTATPVGPGGGALVGTGLYDAMIEAVTNSELIRQGLLLPVHMLAPSEPHIQGVTINDGAEFNQSQLAKKVWSVTTHADILKEWEPHSHRKTIVFAPGVAFCHGLRKDFYMAGYEGAVISAETTPNAREEMFARFNDPDDKLRLLISVDVLREGFDAPIASCVIDLQPSNQLRSVWQKWGRGKRAYEGQEDWVLIDMAGNWWRHLHPNDDPDWQGIKGETTTADMRRKLDKEKEPRRCPACKEVWMGGTKCPLCQWEGKPNEKVRHIRKGDGKLTEIVDRERAPADDWENILGWWRSELYAGAAGRKSLNQCRAAFEHKRKTRLPEGVPGLPPRNSIAWEHPSEETYPKVDIGKVFGVAIAQHRRKRGVQ